MLGLDVLQRDERSNGFTGQITCIIFALDESHDEMAGNSAGTFFGPRTRGSRDPWSGGHFREPFRTPGCDSKDFSECEITVLLARRC